jgi:hypothetical protein
MKKRNKMKLKYRIKNLIYNFKYRNIIVAEKNLNKLILGYVKYLRVARLVNGRNIYLKDHVFTTRVLEEIMCNNHPSSKARGLVNSFRTSIDGTEIEVKLQ